MNRILRQDLPIYNLGVAPMVAKQLKGKSRGMPYITWAFAVGIDEKERGLDGVGNTTREVYGVRMIDEGDGNFRIEVHLKGALYKMIRNMVGTTLDVAWGNLPEENSSNCFMRALVVGKINQNLHHQKV
jgi:tRNA pseudouridine synthase